MSSVTVAATNTATNDNNNAAPTEGTGTVAVRKTLGARPRSLAKSANAPGVGIPAAVRDGASTTMASHTPATTETAGAPQTGHRRICATAKISGGAIAAR